MHLSFIVHNMSTLSCFIYCLLIALSCYTTLSCSKPIMTINEHQGAKKVDTAAASSSLPSLPAKIVSSASSSAQFAHAMKDEARQKRSHNNINDDYKDLSDIIEDLEDNTLLQQREQQQEREQQQVAAAAQAQQYEMDAMAPVTYYMLLQKLKQLQSNEPSYRVRTPRLGRSIDFQLLDNPSMATATAGSGGSRSNNNNMAGYGYASGGGASAADGIFNGIGDDISVPRQFMTRIIKKSVPFKPRLGKRTQVCSD